MNEIGDKCYFLLNGKLSILKPVQYKNVSITTNEYIHYLISLLKYNEISLINKVIEINHIFINIESISNLKILSKGFFLRKADSYLETFKTITKEDFINLLDEFFLKFEDFNLEPEQTWKDIEDINDNNFIEYSDSSDSESEKNDLEEEKKEKKERKEKKEKKEIRSKYMIFKDYMNRLSLPHYHIGVNIQFSINGRLINPKSNVQIGEILKNNSRIDVLDIGNVQGA